VSQDQEGSLRALAVSLTPATCRPRPRGRCAGFAWVPVPGRPCPLDRGRSRCRPWPNVPVLAGVDDMPGLSGAQLCALAHIKVPGLRVLYISGHPDWRLAPHGILSADVRLRPSRTPPMGCSRRCGRCWTHSPHRVGSAIEGSIRPPVWPSCRPTCSRGGRSLLSKSCPAPSG
jgi:hypothetical protein